MSAAPSETPRGPASPPLALAARTAALRERLGLTSARYFTPDIPAPLPRLLLAAAITLATVAAMPALGGLFGDARLPLAGLATVALAAWPGRFVGALVATAGWAIALAARQFEPLGSPRIDSPEEARSLLLFVLTGAAVGLLAEGLHAARRGGLRLATERQQLAEELLVDHNRLEAIFANLPGLVWELRVEPPLWPPQVDFASTNATRLTGYPAEQWCRSNLLWETLVPDSGRVDFEDAVRAAVRRGGGHLRHVWRHADGTLRTFDTYLTARPSRSGARHDVRCVSIDVTALETAERAVADAERRFRSVADHAPVLIRVSRPDSGTVWCNRTWLDFRGRTLEEEAGEGWYAGVHPDDCERVRAGLASAFAAQEEYRLEYRLRHADGQWRWVLSIGVPRHDPRGDFQDYLGFCIDISEHKQLELEREELLHATEMAREAAELATRSKDEFLAKVSHELRNPLNGILGWTQLLTAPESTEEELRRGVGLIDLSARTLARLVDDLLDLSRILSGKFALTLAPTQLAPVIDAACDQLRPAAAARDVALEARISGELPLVLGDATRLQQVLCNLLSNAVKFTPRGGHVRLAAEQQGSTVELRVQDDGAGIDAAFLPHVFAPFRQADGGADRHHQGLGLGLSIVAQLVERHGGTVGAASPGPGRGSTFTVRLPVAPVDASVPNGGAVAAARLDELRVLVVDDDAVAREVLRTTLARSGAAVREAASAAEAFAEIATAPPDVVVSDIEMPGEDGLSLLRRIRSLPAEAGGTTPAVALTAYARPSDRRAALAAGFQEHLAKPVETAALLAAVGRLARR